MHPHPCDDLPVLGILMQFGHVGSHMWTTVNKFCVIEELSLSWAFPGSYRMAWAPSFGVLVWPSALSMMSTWARSCIWTYLCSGKLCSVLAVRHSHLPGIMNP